MRDDSFKLRYRALPVAVSEQDGTCPLTRLHNHEELEMLLVCDGSVQFRIADRAYSAAKGDMLFVNPGQVHGMDSCSGSYRHKCICFDCSILPDATLAKGLKNGTFCVFPLLKNSKKDIQEWFCRIFEGCLCPSETTDMEMGAYLTLLFAALLKQNRIEKRAKVPKEADFTESVYRYIAENFAEDITSKQAAEQLCYNHSYFCRAFQKNFGMRFSAYLTAHRIAEAKKLLEQPDKTVTEIAYACGFNTPEYFSKCFKEYVGILPSLYKKSQSS